MQIGIQSGAATSPHDHSTLAKGGTLNPYSLYGAYREAYAGSTVSLANNTERTLVAPTSGAEVIKRTRFTLIVGGFQQGTFTIRYDYHNTLGVGFPIDMWLERWGSAHTSIDYFANDNSAYLTRSVNWTGTLYTGDYITVSFGISDSGNVGYCRNLQCNFSWRIRYFGDGTTRILSTPLALTDTDNPFTYSADDP